MCKRNTEQGKPYKRYRYKWNSRAFKALICSLSIVLLLLGAYGAWILSKTLRLSYDRTDAVSNAKQLISQIEYGSRTGEKLNIILKNILTIHSNDVLVTIHMFHSISIFPFPFPFDATFTFVPITSFIFSSISL